MVKYYLIKHEVTVKIYSKQGTTAQNIVIRNGEYNKKIYGGLLIDNECVMLEGEEIAILATEAKVVIIDTKPTIAKIAELVGSTNVYSSMGIDCVPEGQERDILKSLIEAG